MSATKKSRSSEGIGAPSFRIEIDGANIDEQDFSAQSIGVDLVLDGHGTFTVQLVSNGNGAGAASWMDDPLLRIGKQVKIAIGDAKGPITIMDGSISSMRANFPSDGRPMLELAGDDSRSVVSKKGRRKTIEMGWGEGLLTFEPEIGPIADTKIGAAVRPSKKKPQAPEAATITGIGECIGSPEILPGCTVRLDGLGTAFSGDYQVIRTVHTMNRTEGYRTMIMVTK